MAKRSIITDKGLELLGSSSAATGQYYWLGYYSLAYVPNYWKSATAPLPACKPDGDPSTRVFTETIESSMTQLTQSGDMIYNIFQGDLVGTGYYSGASDGSAGGDLFGLSMYDRNIKKHYRYKLDDNGQNVLLSWVDDPTDTEGLMLGHTIYKGTDGFIASDLCIPAPLYYIGDVSNKSSVSAFFPDFDDAIINGSSIYPYIDLERIGVVDITIPKVSVDTRGYLDSFGTDDIQYPNTGQYFDSNEIPNAVSGFDDTDWFSANNTLVQDYLGSTDATINKGLWKLVSISNYNRYHAPVSSVGHVLQSDLKNRNMAKTTKFFPISNYKVINSQTGFTQNTETRELATAISIGIDLNLAPNTKGAGFDDGTMNFEENVNLTFFDKYDNPSNTDQLHNTTSTSFKFNRLGIYAVPLRKAPYVINESDPSGKSVNIEFEINPDDEPILFAVVDWDNTIHMSDTGDGLHQYREEFNINFAGPLTLDDSSLIRDTTIFYNLYQDDSLIWYQNQLIATASTQNAITEIGLEVAHIKNKVSELACCPPPNFDDKYSLRNHTHNDGIRNLLDANIATDGGLRGIDTHSEGDESVIAGGYVLGKQAVALGFGSIAGSEYSFANGYNARVYDNAKRSVVSSGYWNRVRNAYDSSVLGGSGNIIDTEVLSNQLTILGGQGNSILRPLGSTSSVDGALIGTGFSNTIQDALRSTIVNGNNNLISSGSDYSIILGGVYQRIIEGSGYSVVLGGANNNISGASSHSLIGVTQQSLISASSYNSGIILGTDHEITSGNINSLINSGKINTIINNSGGFNYIGSGELNSMGRTSVGVASISSIGTQVAIVSESNIIDIKVGMHIYVYDTSNTLKVLVYDGIVASVSGGGDLSVYTYYVDDAITTDFSAFSSGYVYADAVGSGYSVIGGGKYNMIGGSVTGEVNNYNIIGVGEYNRIVYAKLSAIISGSSNVIGDLSDVSIISTNHRGNFIGGGYRNGIGGNTTTLACINNSILGGTRNYINDTVTSVISGGAANGIYNDSDRCGVFSGQSNVIQHSIYSAIVSGNLNVIGDGSSEITGSVILGGASNAIVSRASYATVIGGSGSIASHYGETVHSSGTFTGGGLAQHSTFIMRGQIYVPSHNGAVVNDVSDISTFLRGEVVPLDQFGILTLDGGSDLDQLITIQPGQSLTGNVTITAHIPWGSDSNFLCNPTTSDGDEHYVGASWYEMYAFTVMRSHKITFDGIENDTGGMVMATQLLSSTASSAGMKPIDSYKLNATFDTYESFIGAVGPTDTYDTTSAGFAVQPTQINLSDKWNSFGIGLPDGRHDIPSYQTGKIIGTLVINGLLYMNAYGYALYKGSDALGASYSDFINATDQSYRAVSYATDWQQYSTVVDSNIINVTGLVDGMLIGDTITPSTPPRP